MKQGNLCGAVFLDLTKAFGTVGHCTLSGLFPVLSGLNSISITGNRRPAVVMKYRRYLGDKDNPVPMDELQVVENKVNKIMLERPLHSSATEALSA